MSRRTGERSESSGNLAGRGALRAQPRGAEGFRVPRGTDVPVGQAEARYERLVLADGWTALISDQCHAMALEADHETVRPDRADWRSFLEQLIRDPTELSGYTLLKYSEYGEVLSARWRWPGGGLDVIARRSRARGVRRALTTWLRSTRERRNFLRALQLIEDGVDTACPLALVEGGGGAAWLVLAFLPGLVDLDQIALTLLPRVDPRSARRLKGRLIERVAVLFAKLQQSGWRHRDLKASNVMLTHWDQEEARTWLVDLDGLKRGRRRQQVDVRPVIRLAASLTSYRSINRTDGARFVIRLLELVAGDARGWREMLRRVAQGAADYNRRASGRKRGKLDEFGSG